MDIVKINDKDTVGVDLATGHKVALADMSQGTDVIKYGFPIGVATCDIAKGEHVHTHNVKTKLSGNLSYEYTPHISPLPPRDPFEIEAFVRDKMRFSGWGAFKLRAALRNKGIANEIVDEVLCSLDRDDMSERLRDRLERKMRTTKYTSRYELKSKLMRYGASLGYDFESVAEVVDALISDIEE